MKKLYFLNEEESKRILNLHKNATKKQYLSEQSLSDQELDETDWGSIATGAQVGAAAGAVAGVGFGVVGAIPGALIGGAIGLATAIFNGGTYSYEGVARILQVCKSNSKEMGKPLMSRQELSSIADGVNTAIEGMGTDEDAIKSNLSKIKSIPDLCGLVTTYQTRHGESLFEALDDDIDSESDWKNYVYLPLLDAYENSKELGEKAAAAAAVAPSGTTSGTTDTTNVVKKGGVSNLQPKTKTIQSTLGVSQTGTMDQATIDALMVKLQGSGQ
jgi:hypothetical protein